MSNFPYLNVNSTHANSKSNSTHYNTNANSTLSRTILTLLSIIRNSNTL